MYNVWWSLPSQYKTTHTLWYRMRILLQDLPVPNLSIMPSLSYIVAPCSLSLSLPCLSICDVLKSDVPGDLLLNMYMAHLRSEHSNDVIMYTDNSKCDNGVGSATVTPNRTLSTRLPDESSVLTAELQAIRTALAALIINRSNTFVICSDSRSAVHDVCDTFSEHPMIPEIHRWLSYVPGHGKICTLLLGAQPLWCWGEWRSRHCY